MLRKSIIISICCLMPFTGMTQSETDQSPENLKESYQELISKSENYNDYKVIKSTRLNAFWKTIEDSLSLYRGEIRTSNAEIKSLSTDVEGLEARIKDLEQNLEQAVARADGINIFGLLVHKNTYNIIVWGIIAALGGVIFFLFGSHMRSKNLYRATRKEFRDLVEEFEDYRKKSYDKKIKMGRELQTERNKVEDLKNKLSLEKGKLSAK